MCHIDGVLQKIRTVEKEGDNVIGMNNRILRWNNLWINMRFSLMCLILIIAYLA